MRSGRRMRIRRSVHPWLVWCSLVAFPVMAAADDLASIGRDFDVHMRILDPVRAGQRGDRDALRRWPDNSPAAVAERKQRLRWQRAIDANDREVVLD